MKSLGVLVVAICLTIAAPAFSQEKLADTMDLVRDQARADKKRFIADNLQLTESEAAAFWPLYERYQRDLDTLNTRIANLLREYGKNYRTMSDEVADRLVTEAAQVEVELAKLADSYLPLFRKVLPGKKLARYHQLEHKIRALLSFDLAKEIPLVQ